MHIALRTSGGRGEYELAGNHLGLNSRDLEGHEFNFQFSPVLQVPGNCRVDHAQGKPRIRLTNPTADVHLYRVIAALLLMPEPKRELSKTPATALNLDDGAYSVTSIPVQIIRVQNQAVLFSVQSFEVRNSGNERRTIEVADRLARVFNLWDQAQGMEGELAHFLRLHKSAILNFNAKQSIGIRNTIYELVGGRFDRLSRIERMIGVVEVEPAIVVLPEPVDENDTTSLIEARVRQLRRWRLQAERGPTARAFRRDVRAAYRDTCLITGRTLPKLPSTGMAGVDAAHILPWANFEADTVNNGLCLAKDVHWAFDSGLIRVDFAGNDGYVVSVPNRVVREATAAGFDLPWLESLTGVIPSARLPQNPALWPSANYLGRFNELLFG